MCEDLPTLHPGVTRGALLLQIVTASRFFRIVATSAQKSERLTYPMGAAMCEDKQALPSVGTFTHTLTVSLTLLQVIVTVRLALSNSDLQ